MNRRRAVTALAGAAVVVLGAVVLWPRAAGIPAGISVRLKNFSIDAPDSVRAGSMTFVAFGEGPSMHELNIAETTLDPTKLPTSPDGTIDDETEHPDFHHVAEAEGIDIGDHATLHVTLPPGHYVMYCNMEGHYQAGMVKAFEVTP
jgi:uncharacterized cupredoxin-like copper-binding protein